MNSQLKFVCDLTPVYTNHTRLESTLHPTRNFYLVLIIICLVHILAMVPFSVYPTLIPQLQVEWRASSTEIGWVAGIYFAGYLLAVLFLVPFTDRVAARTVYLYSIILTSVVPLAFAYLTTGVSSASIWRFLQGIGLAGTYMPGLKALVDAVPTHLQSRTVAYYTMCFGIGVAVSFFISGILAPILSWQMVFVASSIGPLAGFIIAYFYLPSVKPAGSTENFRIFPNFRPVFRNKKALGFSIAYSVHNVELFVFRSWAVAFLVFAMSQGSADAVGIDWNASFLIACATLIGQPFSVITNEIAEKLNRVYVILAVMGMSAIVGIFLGFSSQQSMLIVLTLVVAYAILTIADSASISSAVIKAASTKVRGTTMAFHTLIGFIGAFIGPIIFGFVLDVAGGSSNPSAWGWAFVITAVIVLIGPVAILKTSVVKN